MDESSYVAECFWPGVSEVDLGALDRRATASAEEASRAGEPVRYLGSILMRVDEVVLCRFEGDATAVRLVAERAAIPFDRIVETFQL
ncbi:MAG TPA: hypothetical protein VGQ38_18760 [Gaiellaceae bacterium]|jgi:hypothetical protein|nr:hypothetical protein [Gaiellaceae bacterium]